MWYLIYLLTTHITQSYRLFMQKSQKALVFQLVLLVFFSSIRSCSFEASLAYRPLVLVVFSSLSLCSHSYAQSHACLFLRAYMLCLSCYHFLGRSF